MSQPPYLDRPPRLQKGFGEFISLLSTAAILWSSDDASSLTEWVLQNNTKNVFISKQPTVVHTAQRHWSDVTLKILLHSTHKNIQKIKKTTQHTWNHNVQNNLQNSWSVCMCVCVPAQWDVSVLTLLLCPCFQWQPVRILHSICHTVLTMVHRCLEIH